VGHTHSNTYRGTPEHDKSPILVVAYTRHYHTERPSAKESAADTEEEEEEEEEEGGVCIS
jgi:hypothetical protein